MGLVRAFMLAGAESVVATLWRVDERRTVVDGTILCGGDGRVRLCRSPAPGANAMREHANGQFADPFYWAPFMLISSSRAG